MKKRILAILFALTLAATMLPAGLAVSAADDNLIVNGSFEVATEETDTVDEKLHGAKNWPVSMNGIGTRVLYADAEAMGDLEPLEGTGDACFAIMPPAGKTTQEALWQAVQLEAGKKYTVSFLFYKKSSPQFINASIAFNRTSLGNSPGGDVQVMRNVNYTAASDCWKRVTKTFEVPGTPGEMVDTIFNIHTSASGYDGNIYGYIDDVRLVEAENQEKTVWSTEGFDGLVKASAGVINEPGFPFSANSHFYGLNDDGASIRDMKGAIWDTPTTDFVTYEDGNTVLRLSTHDRGISKVILNVPETFADAGVALGTLLRISYKARLVDIPDDLDTSATTTFGPHISYGYTNCPTYEPYIVGSNRYEVADSIKDAGGNVVPAGTQIYLEIPQNYTTGMIPVSLSTQNVNEADKNANEWVEYEVVVPYTGEILQAIITSGCTNVNMNYSLATGYSWELDDMEITVAESGMLPGNGALADYTYSIKDSTKAAEKVVQGWANADGTGAQYTVTPAWQHGWDDWKTISYYSAELDADKNPKKYTADDTTGGAAVFAGDDATGASLVTAVYKVVGDVRTLVGVGVNAAEAGLVAAPEVALAGITGEAGTYEVKTYIWNMSTMTTMGSTIVEVAAE